MAFGQVVEYADGVAFIEQQFRADAADVAGSADDQNFHRASCGAPARRVKTNRAASASTLVCFEAGDHAPNHADASCGAPEP